MDDLISRQAAIEAILAIKDYGNSDRANALGLAECAITTLPSAQPEKRTEERTETHACDCISREAAIDAMDDIANFVCVKDEDYILQDEAIDNLKQLPSAQQWIPCSERLPEVGKTILISDGCEVLIGHYSGGDRWTVDGCEYDPILEEVAWMPLPTPWGGDEE